jgi:hypothetical protein
MTSNSSGKSGSPSLGDNTASVDIVNQARGRSDGFEVGGDRAISNPPNWNYQDSNQLYQGAVNNNDPATAEATGQAWGKHGTELSQASNDLYNAISELGAVWVGEGAAAAQGALVGIANSGSQASEAAHTMATRLAQQAAAAAEVKKMPAPKNYDPASAMAASLAGGPAAMVADQKAQSDAAADVKAQQVAFFNAYTKSMAEVDSTTPSFGPESLGMKPTAGHNSVSSYSNVGGVGAGGIASGGPGAVGSVGSVNSMNGPTGVHGTAAAGSYAPDSGHFGASSYVAPPAPAAAPGLGAGGGAGGGSFAPPAPVSGGAGGAGGAGGNIGSALGLGVVGGGLGIAGSRALGQGNKSGSKDEDDTTTAASNNNQAQSAASVGGPQQQGVVSASGTIGGSSTPPMGGMGGMGGGGHQLEEDETHTHASFLIEPDPDDTFGANEATPPPVIGAWTDDDDR